MDSDNEMVTCEIYDRAMKRKFSEVTPDVMDTSDTPKNGTKFKVYTHNNEIIGYYDLATIRVSGVYKEMFVEVLDGQMKEVGCFVIVDATIVRKVFEWMEHYKDGSPDLHPIRSDSCSGVEDAELVRMGKYEIPEWDQKFLAVDRNTLYGIFEAANYLDVELLERLALKTIANKFKKKQT